MAEVAKRSTNWSLSKARGPVQNSGGRREQTVWRTSSTRARPSTSVELPAAVGGGLAVFAGNDFKLHSLNTRAALPGSGRQALHTDWAEAVPSDRYQVCNSVWMLDDFTEENGPTRVVPGSHRWGKVPKDAMEDPTADHPNQLLMLGSAGTCVVFNSICGTAERRITAIGSAGLTRPVVRRGQAQQTAQRDFLRPETLVRLTPAQRYLVDA